MAKIIFGDGVVGRVLFDKCIELKIDITGFCDEDKSKKALSIEEAKKLGLGFLIATGSDVSEKLKGCEILHEETARLLEQVDLTKLDRYAQFCVLNCIDCNRNYDNPFFLRSLDVMVTEKCSLRCRDCSNLMQYYEQPKHIAILNDLVELLDTYSAGEFRVIGGEPFLNPMWCLIVEYLIDNEKAKRIVIYTNGTVVPGVEYLKRDEVFVMVTNYGKLSYKLEEIKTLFDKHGIAYKILEPKWTDCGKIEKHSRTIEELKQMFRDCCSRNSTLSDGKLYDCAFSANLARLGIYDNRASCDYCNGRPLNATEIEPAVQMAVN